MGTISGGHVDPHLRRWMLFVDGENLAIRWQRVSEAKDLSLKEGEYFLKNVFAWPPTLRGTAKLAVGHIDLQPHAIRAYYYTSVVGDTDKQNEVKDALQHLGFNPVVYKKNAQSDKAKGVDIALTKDVLRHAFRDHYDVALLVAGDGDYVPVVEEVKSLGKVVYVSFFEKEGLNPELRRAADFFFDITSTFLGQWKSLSAREEILKPFR
jgi:uncharacterized LabA/DUF88 family protein